jgi:hypothetical protein
MLKLLFSVMLITNVILLSSCKKTEGEGGTGEISGKVLLIRFDASYSIVMDTVVASDEDVYIIYGNNSSTYNDDFKTSYDGTYAFRNLIEGNYRLFVYNNDSTGASVGLVDNSLPKIPVLIDVKIESGEKISAPVIYIIDY